MPVALGYQIFDDGNRVIRVHRENIDVNTRSFTIREEIPKRNGDSYKLRTILFIQHVLDSADGTSGLGLPVGLTLGVEHDYEVVQRISKIAGICKIEKGLLNVCRKAFLRPSVLATIVNAFLVVLCLFWAYYLIAPHIIPGVPNVEFELKPKGL